MRKVVGIIVLILIQFLVSAQGLTDTERSKVTSIAEQYAASYLSNSWNCPITNGSTVISGKEVLGNTITYSGKVSYRSSNCGAVNANLRIQFRQQDDAIYLTRLCIQMPYCIFGNVLRHDNECQDYYQRFDSWLQQPQERPAPSTQTPVVSVSDVDRNIPRTTATKPNAYALIIGNEDYASFQPNLSIEVNVDYAINDAKIFAEYCTKTLGIPQRQVKLLTNATAAQMRQGISWLSQLAEVEDGKAELIFYYSGHGLPDEVKREPHLIPVDVSSSHLDMALPLDEVYEQLKKSPTQRCVVLLDACFSGGARNKPLVAAKAVRVVPRTAPVSGNMLVLASSSNEESSGVYSEEQHGYFTYFLLKQLQETSGNTSYGNLFDYVHRNVARETLLSGKKQTPSVTMGTINQEAWKSWKVVE